MQQLEYANELVSRGSVLFRSVPFRTNFIIKILLGDFDVLKFVQSWSRISARLDCRPLKCKTWRLTLIK